MKAKIVILGSGNLGHHLACAFSQAGHSVSIWNRTLKHIVDIVEQNKIKVIENLFHIPADTDLCIVALPEYAMHDVCRNIPAIKGILVHTSGATSINEIKNYAKRYGVIYPLQTFTKRRRIDYSSIPVFIEAGNKEDYNVLFKLCSDVFNNIFEADSEKRSILHLAAVFACNFVNASLLAAEEITHNNKIEFSHLYPLIKETISKSVENLPSENQTGPAKRKDFAIIEKHLKFFEDKKELKNMYENITNYIIKFYDEKV